MVERQPHRRFAEEWQKCAGIVNSEALGLTPRSWGCDGEEVAQWQFATSERGHCKRGQCEIGEHESIITACVFM
jgi:hypothetical protein